MSGQALREELPPEHPLANVILLEFGENLGQHAALFADARQRQEQGRKDAFFSLEGVFQTDAVPQRVGDAAGHRTHAERTFVRLKTKGIDERQARAEIMAQGPA